MFVEEFGVFLVPVTDGLVRRDASDLAVDAAEVVEDEPAMKIVFHLLQVLIDVAFGGAFFDQAIGAFHHAVGLGRVGFDVTMFDCPVMADLGEERKLFSDSVAVAEGAEGKLAPVVCEYLLDFEGEKLQTSAQEVRGCGAVAVGVNRQIKQTCGAVNGDVAVVFLAVEFGQVEAVDV